MVLRFNDALGPHEGCTHIALFHLFDTFDHSSRAQMLVHMVFVRRHGALGWGPLHLQESCRLDRIPLFVGHHGQEVLLTNDLGTGDRLNGRLIDRGDGGTGQGCSHHARVQDARHANVTHKLTRAVNAPGQIGACNGLTNDLVVGGFFERGFALDLQGVAPFFIPLHLGIEVFATNEVLVAHLLRGLRQARDHALVHYQVRRGGAQLQGRHLDQQATRFGCGLDQRLGAGLNAKGTRGAPLVQGFVGTTKHDIHTFIGHVQLLGHHLCQGNHQALTEIDFTKEGGHLAIGRDGHPGVELIGVHAGFGVAGQGMGALTGPHGRES